MPVILITPEELAKANKALADLDKKQWLGELAQRVSAGELKFVGDEFNTSTDPYGKSWPPLKTPRTRDRAAARRAIARGKAPRGPKVLIHTSRMRSSAGASATGRIARVVIPTWYAVIHQKGGFVKAHTRKGRDGEFFFRKNSSRRGYHLVKSHDKVYTNGFRIPQRMMLPEEDLGIPEKWNAMMETEADKLLWQKFGVRR